MSVKEFLTEKECENLQREFRKNMSSYKGKKSDITDQEWLKELILKNSPDMSEEQAEKEAGEILDSLEENERNLDSLEKAAKQGNARENWLSNKLQESAIGMSAEQYSSILRQTDEILYKNNQELADALSRASDGHIMMNPNPDGNLAEHMIARTTELQGYMQNKNIKVEVRGVNAANSVDVRATNLDTGHFQNYQLKFGKDAQATIRLIERGNYNNQQIIVPSEQLGEVREYFAVKGSPKAISDHIEIDGIKGASFTKEEMKSLRVQAQENGVMPTLDDYYYSTKEYALSVGKNAGVMALQMAAVTTGLDIISKIAREEEVKADEVVEKAITTGADTGVKVVAAGTLHGAVRKGALSFLPKTLGAGTIASIAFVGVENAKVLIKMAEGKLSMVGGLDRMGQITTAMVGGIGIAGLVQGAAAGIVGGPVGVGISLVAGIVGYTAGSSIGEKVYSTARKVAQSAKELGKKALNGLKETKEKLQRKLHAFRSLFA